MCFVVCVGENPAAVTMKSNLFSYSRQFEPTSHLESKRHVFGCTVSQQLSAENQLYWRESLTG